MRSNLIGLVAAVALTAGCGAPAPSAQDEPLRIIFMVADGAGTAHWTLASYSRENLSVERMPTVGLVDTRGSDHTVSGSAPTASAYATGVRTFMGAISVGPDSLPRETVLEAAMARGMSAGLATTTFLADATPAAFGAHAISRGQVREIAAQMTSQRINVLMGGGRRLFPPEIREGYTYVETLEELGALQLDTVDALLGMLAEGELGVVAERGSALLDMTSAALAILDRDPEGFFLMVENEESDTQSHQNAPVETIRAEMLDFDAAVGLALDYQAAHPETLVLVTGDHETGGLTLPYDEQREPIMRFEWGGHTGAMVPLFAIGPGAERFGGILRNEEVGRILLEIVRGP